jgi:hypothetical protein
MAELIAPGTAAANSDDFTLGQGEFTTISLKPGDGAPLPTQAAAYVQKKQGAGYLTIGQIDQLTPAKNLTAIGTYRVYRDAGGWFGVDRD